MNRTVYGATGAAFALATTAVIQLSDDQSSEATTIGIEHLTVALLAATLVLLVPVMLRLGELGARRVALVPITGQLVLAVLSTISNVRGEDPSFFAAIAVPANLAIFGGWIALAVILRRRDAIPTWLAIALPLAYIGMIPASMAGGGFVSALIWLALARRELPARQVALA